MAFNCLEQRGVPPGFRRLTRVLAVLETAGEEVVHPYVKRTAEGGEAARSAVREARGKDGD